MAEREPSKKKGVSRRELLGHAGRAAALLAAGALVARLAGRKLFGSADQAGRGPAPAARCARCNVFDGCLLPEAEAARRQGLGLIGPVRRAAPGWGTPPPDEPRCGQTPKVSRRTRRTERRGRGEGERDVT